jgi:hypothetical protein
VRKHRDLTTEVLHHEADAGTEQRAEHLPGPADRDAADRHLHGVGQAKAATAAHRLPAGASA